MHPLLDDCVTQPQSKILMNIRERHTATIKILKNIEAHNPFFLCSQIFSVDCSSCYLNNVIFAFLHLLTNIAEEGIASRDALSRATHRPHRYIYSFFPALRAP